MKKILITALQVFISTLILFSALEFVCFLVGLPQGASRYIETIILREKLSLKKPKGEFRIFTYGESTMHGTHYWPFSNPARWLEVYLKDFLPDKKIRVVNFARMGHESHFIYHSFRDTVAYQPDVAIFYSGNNELLPGNLLSQLQAKERTFRYQGRELVRRSRFLSLVYRLDIRCRVRHHREKSTDSVEYKVIESSPSSIGLENSISRNMPAYAENIEDFKRILLDILDIGKSKNIPILFFKPVTNLKDFSPSSSIHIKHLSSGELSRWESLYGQGKKAQDKGDLELAQGFYEQAYALDDTYADLCFRLGQIYFKNGNLDRAKRLFEQARDNDVIIVRATSDIVQVLEELRRTEGLQLIDTEKILSPEAPGGILGEPIIEDNRHPSIKGQSLLGRAAAQEIANRNWLAPRAEWRFDRERPYEEIVKELGITPDLLFSADLKMVHYFGSRFENRIRYAKKALEIHPNHPRALRHPAWTYWLMGEKEKALETYRILGQIDPPSLQAVFQNQPFLQNAFDGDFNTAS